MRIVKGKSVFEGIVIGKVAIYKKGQLPVKSYIIEDIEKELRRLELAKEVALKQLQELYEEAMLKIGEAKAMLFQVHQMMLEDADYNDSIREVITSQKVNSEYAIHSVSERFAEMFESMEDAYMRARAIDVRDISQRFIAALSGQSGVMGGFEEPVILLADDLTPSETVQLDKDKILAIVTRKGSSNSHTAIFARTMSIPTLVATNIELDVSYNGMEAIVNGFTGEFILQPDQDTKARMEVKRLSEVERKELLLQLKGKKNVTLDGYSIQLSANIGNVSDVESVLENDAEGVGLFRSEFLYLESNTYPTEEEQFIKYRCVLEQLKGKRVIIRTLDIGADKQVDYFNMPKEENPALGCRAIRLCLEQIDVFRTQLRALYRASAYGNLSIMFPMIISLDEVLVIKEICESVKQELDSEGIAYDKEVQLGVMVETPAAVMVSKELAKEVDFFSIGTNDLTQYTLAIDRQNPKLDKIYNAQHPAVFRMIKMVVDSAHTYGKWVGICGELCSDLGLVEVFLSMGVDELSVLPSAVLPLRKKIRSLELEPLRQKELERI